MNQYETYLTGIILSCLFLAGIGFIANGYMDRHRKGFGKIFSVILGAVFVLTTLTLVLLLYKGQFHTGLATAGFVFY